jgi:hypothetical protein
MWYLWWTKWQWGTFSPSSLVHTVTYNIHAPHSSSSVIRGWYIGQIAADVTSGLGLTPPRKKIAASKSPIYAYQQ